MEMSPERMKEIRDRARLAAALRPVDGPEFETAKDDFHRNGPYDVRDLLSEVERLRAAPLPICKHCGRGLARCQEAGRNGCDCGEWVHVAAGVHNTEMYHQCNYPDLSPNPTYAEPTAAPSLPAPLGQDGKSATKEK